MWKINLLILYRAEAPYASDTVCYWLESLEISGLGCHTKCIWCLDENVEVKEHCWPKSANLSFGKECVCFLSFLGVRIGSCTLKKLSQWESKRVLLRAFTFSCGKWPRLTAGWARRRLQWQLKKQGCRWCCQLVDYYEHSSIILKK